LFVPKILEKVQIKKNNISVNNEKRLRLALDAAEIALWELNVKNNEISFSDNYEKLFGIKPKSFDGKYDNFLIMIHHDDRERIDKILKKAVKLKISYDEEFRTVWPDKTERWLRIRGDVHLDKKGGILSLLGSIHDKTDRKLYLENLQNTHKILEKNVTERTKELANINKQLRDEISERKKLQKEIMNVSEMEQQRIGQDLHDSISQQIGGILFMSQVLYSKLNEKDVSESEELNKIINHLNTALKHIRKLSKGLYPIIGIDGLYPALKELSESQEDLYKISIHLNYDESINGFDDTTSIHLYRIVQETINNSIRHGRASKIFISFQNHNNNICMSIKDNGVGFPQKMNRKGIGINIMKYRASIIGASFNLESSKDNGTIINCCFVKK